MKVAQIAVAFCWCVTTALAIQCRVGFFMKSPFEQTRNWQNVQCAASTSYCLYSTSVATIFSSAVELKAGVCSNETTCRPQSCRDQRHLFSSDSTATSVVSLPLTFLSCTFGCCQENLCNYNLTTVNATANGFLHKPADVITPPPPLPTESATTTTQTTTTTATTTTATTLAPPNGVQCFRGYDIRSRGVDLIEWDATDCRGAERKCVTATGNVLIDGYHNATVTVGRCASDDACQPSNCNALLGLISEPEVGIPRSVPDEIQTCASSCCTDNLCNERFDPSSTTTSPPPPPTTTGVPNGLTCDRGYEVDIELLQDSDLARQWNISQCTGDRNYCLRARGHVVVSDIFPSNVEAGLCVSDAVCQSTNCSEIASLMISADPVIESVVNQLGYSVINCSTVCCADDLCNRQTIEEIEANLTPTPEVPNGLTCGRGYEVDIELLQDSSLSRQWNNSQCTGDKTYCLRAKGFVIVSATFPSNVEAGLCVTSDVCEWTDCEDIAALMISADPTIENVVTQLGYEVKNCSTICCQGDLCNRQTIEQIAAGPTEPSTTTPVTSTTCASSIPLGSIFHVVTAIACIMLYQLL